MCARAFFCRLLRPLFAFGCTFMDPATIASISFSETISVSSQISSVERDSFFSVIFRPGHRPDPTFGISSIETSSKTKSSSIEPCPRLGRFERFLFIKFTFFIWGTCVSVLCRIRLRLLLYAAAPSVPNRLHARRSFSTFSARCSLRPAFVPFFFCLGIPGIHMPKYPHGPQSAETYTFRILFLTEPIFQFLKLAYEALLFYPDRAFEEAREEIHSSSKITPAGEFRQSEKIQDQRRG